MKKETDITMHKDNFKPTICVDNSKEAHVNCSLQSAITSFEVMSEIRKYKYEKYKAKYESRIRTVTFGYWILIPMVMTAIYSSLPYTRSLMSFLLNPVKDIVNMFASRTGKLIMIAIFLILFAFIAYCLLLIIIKFIGLIDNENKEAMHNYTARIDKLIEDVKSEN